MTINPALRGTLSVIDRGAVSHADVSGDGEVVVYSKFDEGSTGVFRQENGETVRLSADGYSSKEPTVNEDGTVIAFAQFTTPNPDNTGNWDIVVWDEGEASVIADGPADQENPSISDDGNVLAWHDNQDGVLGQNNIMRSVDGRVEAVTHGINHDMFPEVSGDGERIVWRRFDSGKSNIWLQDQNDVVKPFVNSEGKLIKPSLSNDGRTLVYAEKLEGEEDLVHHNEVTGFRRPVADKEGVRETSADISGDGKTIAWTEFDSREGSPSKTNIYIERDGVTHQVTTSEDGGIHLDPKLSDDGKTLVWNWIDRGNLDNRAVYQFKFD